MWWSCYQHAYTHAGRDIDHQCFPWQGLISMGSICFIIFYAKDLWSRIDASYSKRERNQWLNFYKTDSKTGCEQPRCRRKRPSASSDSGSTPDQTFEDVSIHTCHLGYWRTVSTLDVLLIDAVCNLHHYKQTYSSIFFTQNSIINSLILESSYTICIVLCFCTHLLSPRGP